MIISHSRRFVFVHIHKTAGESITHALAPHLARGDVVLGGTRAGNLANVYYRRLHGLSKHSDARTIRAFLGERDWESYFRFSIVRNPYDRALSFYHYLGKMLARRQAETWGGLVNRLPGFDVRDPLKWPEIAARIETGSFSEYIRHPAFGPAQFGTRTQRSVLSGTEGELLVDLVGHFETIAADFTRITGRIGLTGAALGWHNASSNNREAGTHPSAADRDLLFELYREDFEAFGYSRTIAA